MNLLVLILFTFSSIVWGNNLYLLALPISEYVNTEISTNIVLGTTFQDFREINLVPNIFENK